MPKTAKKSPPQTRELTVREAGKKGGEIVKQRYGAQFYEEIGHIGGAARKRQLGHLGYVALGQKGGRRVRELIEEGKRATEKRQGL